MNGKSAEAGEELEKIQEQADSFMVEVHPNPFKGHTLVHFNSPEAAAVKIEIYNVVGTCVATIFNGQIEGGRLYQAEFNGDKMARGLYFYKLTAPETTLTGKMILQ
jgi:hypothetical protein